MWYGAPLVNFHLEPKGIPFKIYGKFVWRAPGRFPYGNPKEFLSKSVGNLSGELMANSHLETLRNYIEKCVGNLSREVLVSFQ